MTNPNELRDKMEQKVMSFDFALGLLNGRLSNDKVAMEALSVLLSAITKSEDDNDKED